MKPPACGLIESHRRPNNSRTTLSALVQPHCLIDRQLATSLLVNEQKVSPLFQLSRTTTTETLQYLSVADPRGCGMGK